MAISREATQWRDACRRTVARQQELITALRRSGHLSDESSVSAGGDISLVVDREFERIALAELAEVTDNWPIAPYIVTEELGESSGEPLPGQMWVIIDPIDGSTNVRSGLPQFSFSLAVANGPTMADVWFGYVFDFGSGEEFVSERATGVELNGGPIDLHRLPPTSLIAFESAEPALLVAGLTALPAEIKEIRVIGSIAIALCYVGLGRVDGLITCKQCRSVDAAGGYLFATLRGADTVFDGTEPQSAGLRLRERYRIVAARGSILSDLVDTQRAIPVVPR